MTGTDHLEWRTSTYSGDGEACVEVAPTTGWRTTAHSGAGENCVEVSPTTHSVYVRHSKHPDDGTIVFPLEAWMTFISEAREGYPAANGVVAVSQSGTDTLVASLSTDVTLRFDEGEWTAFISGVKDREFDFAATPRDALLDKDYSSSVCILGPNRR